jgi:tripartite-type tricarboxylate transporter receptor subunit TctC
MKRRELLKAATSAAVLGSPAAFAQADWPSRPITMIVAASAGSGTDIMARELANRLSLALKQPVIVEAKPGGSGVLAIQAVLRAPATGYTLLYSAGASTVMSAALLKSLPYDLVKDLVPIAQTVEGGILLSVSKDFPAKDLQGLVQHVKAHPNKFSYGTSAIGSGAHLTMEWLKLQTGMQINHVPYRQVPQMLTEISQGELQMGWSDPLVALPFMESGRVRGIAMSGKARAPRTPYVPTMGEQGYPFETVGWFGVFAAANTPGEIVQRLSIEINRIQALPETATKLMSMNLQPPPIKTPEQFRAIVQNDLQTWRKIVADSGITVDQ